MDTALNAPYQHPSRAQNHHLVAVTGAGGFIGTRLVHSLLMRGHSRIRCLVRPSSDTSALTAVINSYPHAEAEIVEGNLLSMSSCELLVESATVVYHLAAGRGVKSYADAFLNSVVTTRNLLDACQRAGCVRRVVNVSSFSVYSNQHLHRGEVLDERCETEQRPVTRGDAYSYAKVKQDECVHAWAEHSGIPVVTVRPGVVYGPGKRGLPGRVGTDTFGVFLHLGGNNLVPLSYVDNCADAIALSGLVQGVDGEIFNVVDDELPTAREVLTIYKRRVKTFPSISVPYGAFYFFSWLWEAYSKWSNEQIPPVFNRRACETYWKGNKYSNAKAKRLLGWTQRIPTSEGLSLYLDYQRNVRSPQ